MFVLKHFSCDDTENVCEDILVSKEFEGVIQESNDIQVTEKDSSCCIYICGYVSRSVLKHINCDLCKNKLVLDKELLVEYSDDFVYLNALDRGGLFWPTDFVLFVSTSAFKIFTILISETYEKLFMSLKNQRSLLVNLISEKVEKSIFWHDENICNCGISLHDLIENCAKCIANILLNNYSKVKNNILKEINDEKKKCSKEKIHN